MSFLTKVNARDCLSKYQILAASVIAFRGTGPQGIKELRSSSEGVYGRGIYWYDNPLDARCYCERGGGVIVAKLNKYVRHGTVLVTQDAADGEVLGIVPNDLTLECSEFLAEVKKS